MSKFPQGRVNADRFRDEGLLIATVSGAVLSSKPQKVRRDQRSPSASMCGIWVQDDPGHGSFPKVMRSLIGLALVVLTTGCGHDGLERLKHATIIQAPARSPSTASFKTLDPQAVGNQYKFIFIVDESGSNAGNITSDPTGERRFDNIVTFMNMQIQQGIAASYSLIAFNDTARVTQGFTRDPIAFRAAVMNEKAARADSGGTNYTEALGSATNLIAGDALSCLQQRNVVPSYYVVFHISDGVPNPSVTDEEVQTLVGNLLSNAQGNTSKCVNGVTLHTGWYHPGDANPQAPEAIIMSRIAQLGKGEFLDFSNGVNIDLTKYRIPTVQVQMTLVDVLITNQNTVWEGGILKLDSDSDGVSDEKERALGSNPSAIDSDSNGVSDYLENYLYGTPCKGINGQTRQGSCAFSTSQDFTASCGDLRVTTFPVTFRDSDHAGFNDCEKRLLGGREDRWDSNGDWIPDAIEFFRGMNFIAGTHQENSDPYNNGITNREKIKRGMPVDVDLRTLPGFKPYDYVLYPTATDAKGTSYTVEIRNIPVIGSGNKVRIYLFENTLGVKDMRFMRFAEKQINSENGVFFENLDFGSPVRFDCGAADPCY